LTDEFVSKAIEPRILTMNFHALLTERVGQLFRCQLLRDRV
jgi:hypothetical protein